MNSRRVGLPDEPPEGGGEGAPAGGGEDWEGRPACGDVKRYVAMPDGTELAGLPDADGAKGTAEEGSGGIEERTAEGGGAGAVVARARGGRTASREESDCSALEPRPKPSSSRSIGGWAAVGAGRDNLGKEMWSMPGPREDISASSACACAENSKNVVSPSSASIAPKSTSSRSAIDMASGERGTAPFSIMRASATACENDGKPPSASSSSGGGETSIPIEPARDAVFFRPAGAFRTAMTFKPRTPSWRPCPQLPELRPDSCNSATRLRPQS